jgi:hypothetical protein
VTTLTISTYPPHTQTARTVPRLARKTVVEDAEARGAAAVVHCLVSRRRLRHVKIDLTSPKYSPRYVHTHHQRISISISSVSLHRHEPTSKQLIDRNRSALHSLLAWPCSRLRFAGFNPSLPYPSPTAKDGGQAWLDVHAAIAARTPAHLVARRSA